jgi:hypothetical protein
VGEQLWAVRKGASEIRAAICPVNVGCELHVFTDGELWFTSRYESRAAALEGANVYRLQLEAEGWS